MKSNCLLALSLVILAGCNQSPAAAEAELAAPPAPAP